MRITLIHGENLESSQQILSSLIKPLDRYKINIFNPNKDALENLFRTRDLFNETSVYVIESVESLHDIDLKWLKANHKKFDANLILHANRELTQSAIKKLPPIDKVYKSDIPTYLWKLLDSIYPGNLMNSLGLLKITLSNEPIEKVFTLIVNQIKDIYMFKLDNSSINYPQWRLSKIQAISTTYDLWTLEDLIRDLATADLKSKQGANLNELLTYNLSKSL